MKLPFNKSRMNSWQVFFVNFSSFKRHISWLTCRPRSTTAQSAEHPWETMTKKKRRKTSMTMIMSHCLMVNILCITQASVSLISTRIDSDYWNIKWNFLFCSLTLSRSFTVLTMAPCGMLTFFHSPLLSFIFFLFFLLFLSWRPQCFHSLLWPGR